MDIKHRLDEWVDTKLAALTPVGESDTRRAWSRVQAMQDIRPASHKLRLVAALAACGTCIVAIPATRAAAQRIWEQLFLNNVTVLRVNSGALPWNISLHSAPLQAIEVDTPTAAAQRAGFFPSLPPGLPKLAVISSIRVVVDLSTAQLEDALQRAGASDVRVPREWDHSKVGIHIGPIIVATFPADVTLMQLKPIGLTAPVGFALQEFAEVTFRILGLDVANAKRTAQEFTANPSWFLAIPRDEAVAIRHITLRSGKGILMQGYDEDSHGMETALIWSTHDRTFLLSGKMTEERAIAIANDTPTH